jgi:hypothetical protein
MVMDAPGSSVPNRKAFGLPVMLRTAVEKYPLYWLLPMFQAYRTAASAATASRPGRAQDGWSAGERHGTARPIATG